MRTLNILLRLFFAMTILTGLFYPAVVTVIAQLFFEEKADGSLISHCGVLTGSKLIGQVFDNPMWFTSRPSANNYNPLSSGGSNLGPTNKALKKLVNERRNSFIQYNILNDSTEIPAEMLNASASGLDPHISPEAALLQIERISKARGFDESEKSKLYDLVVKFTESSQFHLFGEERINVFMLNLALDSIK
jgi:K+-transporting ATPase ATPase C chain